MMKDQAVESANRAAGFVDFREKWLMELRKSRRVYFFQLWADQRKSRKISAGELFRWIGNDLKFVFTQGINILMNLRKYGPVIRREFGLSYGTQFYRMAYLVFAIHTQAYRFRLNHLFETHRWDLARDLSFSRHIRIHNLVLGYPHREDQDNIAHKLRFHGHCSKYGIPTPEILSVYKSGEIASSGSSESLPRFDLFMKELAGGMGYGVKKFRFEHGLYFDSKGNAYTREKLHEFFKNYSLYTNSILIQKALKNHDSWKQFTGGGLATCRVVTGRSPLKDEEVVPFFATFKMPVKNLEVDNFSKGSVAASVDLKTGMMQTAISAMPINGKFTFDHHPDTGRKITGETLPFWRELIDLSKEVHLRFDTIDIGWDIALTEEGLTVLEGNVEWGSDVIEGPSGVPIAYTGYPEWFDGWVKRRKG